MELRHLEYFLMLSEELHFTRAAEKMGISQPTLSHQIKMLEQDIGYTLFNRIGKKIELTKVGKIVQQEAYQIRDVLQNMTAQIESLSKVEIGELKIAVLPGEMTDLVSTVCIRFNQLYPNIKVMIETTDEVEKVVLEKQADFGIGYQFQKKEILDTIPLYHEEFYAIQSTPTFDSELLFSELFQQPLILFPKTHQCRKLLDRMSENLQKELQPIIETSSISSILELVRSGIGIAIVSRTLYEFYDTQDLFFRTISQPALQRTVHLTVKKEGFMNYAARAYLSLLLEEIQKLHFQTEEEAIQYIEALTV